MEFCLEEIEMLKKTARLLMILLLITAVLSGCSAEKTNQNKFIIVTSFYPMYISAINITKDIENVFVVNMTTSQTGCLHDYQLLPKDLKTLESANAFVINGAGMESFIDETIKQKKNLKIIDAGKGIELIKDKNGNENPHIFVSISNNIMQIKNIANELAVIDTKNADKYKSNANAYILKLTAIKEKMKLGLKDIMTRDIITFHEAFPYFAKEFNLNIVAVIEREPGTAPTPKELENTINIIKNSSVKALFAEPQYEPKAAQTIAKETGAKVYTLDPVVIGEANQNAMDDYINKMENNLKVLKEALG